MTDPDEEDWLEAIKVESSAHPLWDDATSAPIGSIQVGGSNRSPDWYLAIKVGPYQDGLVLEPDDYQPWVRLTDDEEQPVRIAPTTVEIA